MNRHSKLRDFTVKLSTVVCVFMGSTARAAAPEPIDDRVNDFLLQESAFVQDANALQVGAEGAWEPEEDGHAVELEAEIEYGVTSRLSLQAELPVQWQFPEEGENEFGPSNPSVGAMFQIVSTPDRFTLTPLLRATFPALSKQVGEDAFHYDLQLLTHLGLSPVHVQVAPGLDLAHGAEVPDDLRVSPELGAAVLLDLEPVYPIVEAVIESEADEFAYVLSAGAMVGFLEHWQLGFGALLDVSERPVRAGVVGQLIYDTE